MSIHMDPGRQDHHGAAVTRRGFVATVLGVTATAKTVAAREGFHVQGTLVNDTSDLQAGYFSLCGLGTGQCKAIDAIGISVHPKHAQHVDLLTALVGKDVQLSIFVP